MLPGPLADVPVFVLCVLAQIMGVASDADAVALKKAYRTLCLRWHPDKHTTSAEAQQRANTAFMVCPCALAVACLGILKPLVKGADITVVSAAHAKGTSAAAWHREPNGTMSHK